MFLLISCSRRGFATSGLSSGRLPCFEIAVIAATKGEYKADGKTGKRDIPLKWVIALIVLIYLVLWFLSKIGGGGGGGGSYMSGRGLGAFGAGWALANHFENVGYQKRVAEDAVQLNKDLIAAKAKSTPPK